VACCQNPKKQFAARFPAQDFHWKQECLMMALPEKLLDAKIRFHRAMSYHDDMIDPKESIFQTVPANP
jgi:hypothetical protein